MPLLNDIHHLTFITADLDRLIGFYERIFEARVTVDLEEEDLGWWAVLQEVLIPQIDAELQPVSM